MYRREIVVRLILAKHFENIARLFGTSFCSGSITGQQSRRSQKLLEGAYFQLRAELELSEACLEQLNSSGVIPLENQLFYYLWHCFVGRSKCVHPFEAPCGLSEIPLRLVNPRFRRQQIYVIGPNFQRTIIQL